MPETIDHFEIRRELRAVFPQAATFVLDASYHTVTRESVEAFARELFAEFFADGNIQWDEAFDCEDFSLQAWSLAKRKHIEAKRNGTVTAQGVAVGLLCYNIHGHASQGHCVVLIRTRDGWEAWEPQTRKFFTLSPEEAQSAWLVLV